MKRTNFSYYQSINISAQNLGQELTNSVQIYLINSIKQISNLDLSDSQIEKINLCFEKKVGFYQTEIKDQLTWFVLLDLTGNKSSKLEKIRLSAVDHQAAINKSKIESVYIKSFLNIDNSTESFVEGLYLSNYQFLRYKNKAEEISNSLKNIFIDPESISEIEVNQLNQMLSAVTIGRDLVNEPLSYLTAEKLSEEIVALGEEAGFSVEVLEYEKIKSLKMGGLLAVNLGSFDPPTFSILEYKGAHCKNTQPIVLVGKGVVYDTGGLSLKPTKDSMDHMKCDMGGAAAVVGAFYAAAKNKLPVHIIGLIPATDNRPGKNAYVPGDVIEMYSGKTVEVLNTDAEGRMILADALHYAKSYKPELVIDLATLTGSALAALGPQAMAMMSTADQSTKGKLKDAGFNTHERLVEFPLWEEYGDLIKSDIADIKNVGGRLAGAITAGKFLEHFIDYPWIHLDIAPLAWSYEKSGYRLKNGTGTGIRLLYDFLKNY